MQEEPKDRHACDIEAADYAAQFRVLVGDVAGEDRDADSALHHGVHGESFFLTDAVEAPLP